MRNLRLLMLATLASGCGSLTTTQAPLAFDQAVLNGRGPGAYVRTGEPPSEVASSAEVARPAPARSAPASRPHAGTRPAPSPAQSARAGTSQPSSSRHAAPPAGPAAARPGRSGLQFAPEDAAGYVAAVYTANEVALSETERHSIPDLYRKAQAAGTVYHSSRPAVGDMVFFHNTFDRNGDHRANDWYTHIGLVESVDQDGTITVLSYVGRRVSRIYLNLDAPAVAERDGKTLNTQLRAQSERDPAYTEYLAGKLFAGFGSLLGNKTEVVVIDDWQPTPAAASASR